MQSSTWHCARPSPHPLHQLGNKTKKKKLATLDTTLQKMAKSPAHSNHGNHCDSTLLAGYRKRAGITYSQSSGDALICSDMLKIGSGVFVGREKQDVSMPQQKKS
jgi:hypothetical protein